MAKMERSQCLMSNKRQILNSDYFPAPAFRLQAFPTNFLWQPRSYSCSFCTREFKSAQALGGHMNVHRRDRARLKQQSPNNNNNNDQTHKNPAVIKRNDVSQKGFVQEHATCHGVDRQVKTDLSVGLNYNNVFCSGESGAFKRAKTGSSSTSLLFLDAFIGSRTIKHGELDLQLRLGTDPPKVK